MCLVRRAFHCVSVVEVESRGLMYVLINMDHWRSAFPHIVGFFVGASRLVLGSVLRLDFRILRNCFSCVFGSSPQQQSHVASACVSAN